MTPIESVDAQLAAQADIFPIPTTAGILREARVVGIVGSRKYPELQRVTALVRQLHPEALIVNGGAEGIDQAATSAGLSTRRSVVELKPIGSGRDQWIQAAFARNRMIVIVSDIVVAFWSGDSPGTKNTIGHALEVRGLCIVALPTTEPQVWVPRLPLRAAAR